MTHTPAMNRIIRVLQRARNQNLLATGKPGSKTKISQSRRQILKSSAMSVAALAAGASLSACRSGSQHPIVIVGAGLAGLTAGYYLAKLGLKAPIYEARGRVGGRIRTLHNVLAPGLDTDLGGELINSDHEDMLALAQDLGLSLTNRLEPNPDLDKVGYYFNGYRRSEAEIAEALRPLAQQIMTDSELLDSDWDTYAPLFEKQSLTEYLDQHRALLTSDPDVRYLIESTVRVEYGVEAQDSSAIQLLYLLPVIDGDHVDLLSTSDEAFVLNGGSETLTTKLGELLNDHIHLHSPLTKIAKSGQGYELTFNHIHKVKANYVILALPFTTLRQVEIKLDFPHKLTRFINEVDLGRNEKLIASVKGRPWQQQQGFEIEAWSDQSVSLIWDGSLRQPELEDAALTFFLSAEEVAEYAQGTPQEQGEKLLAEYDALIPGLMGASNHSYRRTAWHKTRYIGGGYTNFKPGQYTELAQDWLYIEADDPDERQFFHFENVVFAGEHTSDEYYGFMNGAAQSGRLAAELISEMESNKAI